MSSNLRFFREIYSHLLPRFHEMMTFVVHHTKYFLSFTWALAINKQNVAKSVSLSVLIATKYIGFFFRQMEFVSQSQLISIFL